MNLTTAERVKLLIAAQGDMTETMQSELDAVIATVSGAVERYMGRLALRTARTEYHDAELNATRIGLRAYPVTTLTSVYLDTEQAFGSSALLTSSDYYSPLFNESGLLVFKFPLTVCGPDAIKVTYTGGMATDTDAFIAAYPDLAGAVDQQAAHEWSRRGALGVSAINYPDGTTASMTAERWIPAVKQVLDHYRRVTFA